MINKFNYYFITLFIFSDTIKKYRGTWASLFTVLFLFFVFYFLQISIFFVSIFFLLILFYSYFAIKTCLKNFKESDPQEIVIDEFIGQSIPIILFELFHDDRDYSLNEALQIYFWFF